jgi:parallel beta-helix repeat protein
MKGAKEMRHIKISGWICLIVILISILALPQQAAGASELELLIRELSEPIDFHDLNQELPSFDFPPGRTFNEENFFVSEESRTVRQWDFKGDQINPVEFSLPDFPENSSSKQSRGTCTVTSSADTNVAGTLRYCLANAVAGDLITFNPTNFPPTSPQTISLGSELPPIYDDDLTVDASNAGVILDGIALPDNSAGLVIWGAQGVTVMGMQIMNATFGVVIGNGATYNAIGGNRDIGTGPLGQGNLISGNYLGFLLQDVGTSFNTISGNFIGTNLDGGGAIGNGYAGIAILSGASQNVIGGSHSAGVCDGACNLISGNQVGIQIEGVGSQSNQVQGNFIGTNLQGSSAIPNSIAGIIIWDAPNNYIGGAHNPGVCDGPCNLISGNGQEGIAIQGFDSDNNNVKGNFIGTNSSGISALPNHVGLILADVSGNQIGGAGPGEGNLISGNEDTGLWITSEATTNNIILGNRIGTDVTGSVAVPNYEGILIQAGTGNQVGGAVSGAGNLISGNENSGIYVEYVNAPGISIMGNKIGTNLSGTTSLANYYGIILVGGSGNQIGGTSPAAGNLISGNITSGIHIDGSSVNRVQGNIIGADYGGSVPIPNLEGIFIGFGSCNNLIGGSSVGMGNLISGNTWDGIFIQNSNSVGNQILGNRIGTNSSATTALPNDYGVVIIEASETIIGGADLSTPWVCDGPCNLISGNASFGIMNQGLPAGGDPPPGTVNTSTQVLGNFIGTDLFGTSAIPNFAGVDLSYQAGGNLVGGSSTLGEGNLISGNQIDGVVIRDAWANDNQVSGNRIGTRADGNAALPNGEIGIKLYGSASNNLIGGDQAGFGNLVSGNIDCGIWLGGEGTNNNQILGNRIGTKTAGISALPNYCGIALVTLTSGTEVRGNVISGNQFNGVHLEESTESEISDNKIGVALDGISALPNSGNGVVLINAPENTIGPGNIVAHNRYGVAIVYPDSFGNTITQNSIYGNTLYQIAFFEVPEPLAPAPTLTGWDNLTMTVTGTACGGCNVEVFATFPSTPSGRTYLGNTTAAGDGSFSLMVGEGHIFLAATATDADGTTSEFSNSLQVGTILFVYLPLVLK